MISVYQQKDEYRGRLNRSAAERMNEAIARMEQGTIQSEKLEQLIAELAARLRKSKGRKVYGYLSPQLKAIVDQIVDELAKDERVAAAYDLWQEMQDEVVLVYTDDLPERLPLSRRKEFKTVRNMVVREAAKLSKQEFTFEDEGMEDEPADADEPSTAWEAIQKSDPKQKRRSVYEQVRSFSILLLERMMFSPLEVLMSTRKARGSGRWVSCWFMLIPPKSENKNRPGHQALA